MKNRLVVTLFLLTAACAKPDPVKLGIKLAKLQAQYLSDETRAKAFLAWEKENGVKDDYSYPPAKVAELYKNILKTINDPSHADEFVAEIQKSVAEIPDTELARARMKCVENNDDFLSIQKCVHQTSIALVNQ